MADTSPRTEGPGDDIQEIKTAEFRIKPEGDDREAELHVETLLSSTTGAIQEARSLVSAALEEMEALPDENPRKSSLNHSLGVILEHRLQDPRRAVHHYLEAWRLAPENLAAIRSARRIFWARQNWSMVQRLFDAELERLSSPAERARLLLSKGVILEDWLLASERARECFSEALNLDPSNRQILFRLRRYFWRKGDPRGLLQICRQAADITRDRKYRGLLLSEIGRIQDEDLQDAEAAIASYMAAFVEDPTLSLVRTELKRLHHQHGRWNELVDVLLTEGDLAADPEERAMAYLSAARLCRDRLAQADRALEIFTRVRRLRPDDPAVLQEMADLFVRGGKYLELADTYQKLLELLHDVWGQVLTHYRLGKVLEERLGREDEAVTHFRRAVSLDPTYVPALQSLGKLYQRKGLWAELVAMNAAEVETVKDGEARADRFCGLAELCETQLKDLPRAIEFNRRALAGKPHFSPAERALEHLYLLSEDWPALVDLLRSQVERQAGVEGGRLWQRIGQLAEERLGDVEGAISAYRRAQEHLPGDLLVLRALQRLYGKTEQHRELLEMIDLEIARTESVDDLVALMHRTAELCENKLGEVEQAITRHREILRRAPGNGPTLNALGRIYYRQGRWQEVIGLYATEVEQGKIQPERKGALLYKMGEIYQEHLGNEDAALDAFRRALEVLPKNLPAFEALAQAYRRREEWEALLEIMRLQAEVQTDASQRAALLHEIGEICECGRGGSNLAVQYYRQALEAVSGYEPALRALLRLFSAENRWREVIDLYIRTLATATDESRRIYLLKRLGELYERRALNLERAVEAHEQVLSMRGDDLEAMEALSRLYQRLGSQEKLVGLHERMAFRAKDNREATSHLYQVTQLIEVHQPDRDPAPVYERIRQLDPDDVSALEALARLYGERDAGEQRLKTCVARVKLEEDAGTKGALLLQAAGVKEALNDLEGAAEELGAAADLVDDWVVNRELRRVQERLGQWERVAESLEREARGTTHRVLLGEILMRLALLHQERFNNIDKATAALSRVLDLDPFHEEAAARLEQILVQREAWQELVEILRRRLEAVASRDRTEGKPTTQSQIELLARVAWIQREHLQQPVEAIATLTRSVALDPNHLSTLVTLCELHLALEQWNEAVDVCSRIVAVSDDPDMLRSAHLRLGDLWSEKLDDVQCAISSYQNVLTIAPDDRAALGKLNELFLQNKDWENAADIVTRLIEVESRPELLVEHYSSLAEIHEKGFGDLKLAADQLRHALGIDPTQGNILARFAQIAGHIGDFEAIVDAYRSFLAALPAGQEMRGVLHRIQLGELLRRPLGRTAEALEQFRVVVDLDPTNLEARTAVASILAEEGRLEDAILEHREIQAIEGISTVSLGQMRALWSRMGEHDLAYATAAVLTCLGEAQEADEQIYREKRSRGVRGPQLPIDDDAFESLVVHPEDKATGRRVLAVLGEVAHRLRPPKFHEWHVSKTDRLPPRSEDPLKVLVREVGTVLGLEREVEVFISPTRSRELDILFTDPPSLVIGAGVMGTFSSMEVRFWVGQLLSYLRHRTWVAYGLDGEELGALIRAAVLAIEPLIGTNERELSDAAWIIQRNLSRRGRRALEEAIRGHGSQRDPDLEVWAEALQHTALRAGLWVVNDLEIALSCLRRTDPVLGQAPEGGMPMAQVRRSRQATELIHFWLSEDFLSLTRATKG